MPGCRTGAPASRPARCSAPFVEADRIARDRFPGHELTNAYEAAAIAARVREVLIDARIDFCAETVFSHESKLDLLATATAAGYDVPTQKLQARYGVTDYAPRWPRLTPAGLLPAR